MRRHCVGASPWIWNLRARCVIGVSIPKTKYRSPREPEWIDRTEAGRRIETIHNEPALNPKRVGAGAINVPLSNLARSGP